MDVCQEHTNTFVIYIGSCLLCEAEAKLTEREDEVKSLNDLLDDRDNTIESLKIDLKEISERSNK